MVIPRLRMKATCPDTCPHVTPSLRAIWPVVLPLFHIRKTLSSIVVFQHIRLFLTTASLPFAAAQIGAAFVMVRPLS
jgi:hypothetical protein